MNDFFTFLKNKERNKNKNTSENFISIEIDYHHQKDEIKKDNEKIEENCIVIQL